LGQYDKSIQSFEQVQSKIPYRLIWYQLEPVLAYQKNKNFDKVFSLTQQIIQSGNPSFSEIYQIRGEVYLEQSDKVQAKKEFKKALLYNKNYQPAKLSLSQI
jgi:tetratricopeptide (TPR) repeat protein